jgi:hypothetical protein
MRCFICNAAQISFRGFYAKTRLGVAVPGCDSHLFRRCLSAFSAPAAGRGLNQKQDNDCTYGKAAEREIKGMSETEVLGDKSGDYRCNSTSEGFPHPRNKTDR